MPIPLDLQEVVEALESAAEEHTYYLDKRTVEIVLLTNEDLEAAEEDELISEYPDWQRESILKAREVLGSSADNFLSLPDRGDIYEYQIMEDFGREFANRAIGERLLRLIKGSGAFGRFKHEIFSLGIEEDWFSFKRNRLEEIAIEWLDEHHILYSRRDDEDVDGTRLDV